jgi:tRNA A-37 threonylcarbamoyl transferase component Bud32/TolB-like protein
MTDVLPRLRDALVGRYTIERELGSGATATVFLARDERHNRSVAIKVLNPELGSVLGADRFLREIETIARLQHPHILPLFDSGSSGDLLWFVMPHVAGETLRRRLQRERQLSIEEATTLAGEVADALAYAHQNGVIHRDIKPENILLTSGHALLADFGLTRALDEVDDVARITKTGVSLGTPQYMSPEQATAERALDGRCDIYALGCVLFEMLTGRAPFVGATIQTIVAQHLTAAPPAVQSLRSTVPDHVSAALQRSLAKAPADRFANAGKFAEALRGGAVSAGEAAQPTRTRRIAVVLAGVLALATAAIALMRERGPVSPAARSILVVPFAPATPDSGLTRLGRELALTLSTNLDGVGGIQTVHPLAVLAQAGDRDKPYSLEQAVTLARRLGARSVVHGSLVRVGLRVRVDLALFEGDDQAPVVQASATSAGDDITALTDSATWAFLAQVWRRGQPPSPSLAAITTRSIPALRAFLEGERDIAHGNFRLAARAFQRAIEEDSAFWLAHWRYAYSLSWHGQPVDSAVRIAFETHRDRFPVRDRALIEARMPRDSLTGAIHRFRAVTERYPDYWPAWLRYQDFLVHNGGFVGFSYDDSRAALERLVLLNPELVPAWTHLHWIAVYQRDTATSRRVVQELTRLRADSLSAAEDGLDNLALSRALDALVHTGGPLDTAAANSGVELLMNYRGPIPLESLPGALLMFGFPVAEIDFTRRILARRDAPTALKVGAHRALAMSHVKRGSWDSALVAAAAFADSHRQPESVHFGYQLAAVSEWLGATDSMSTKRWRVALGPVQTSLSPAAAIDVLWLDGLVAVTRRDTIGLARARAQLTASRHPDAVDLERSLAGLTTHLRGDGAAAGQELASVEWQMAQASRVRPFGARHPFFMAVNRLAAARALGNAGDAATGERLLHFVEAVLTAPRHELANRAFEGAVWFERGRLAEVGGRPEAAVRAYRRALEEYDAPAPGLRWMVDAARNAIAKLGG